MKLRRTKDILTLLKGRSKVSGDDFRLVDGSRVAVMGGGPAGSMFSYFLLGMAEMAGTRIHLDLFEPKDFNRPGPAGCNYCGGIISEFLVQILATEGIILPSSVVQRGIDSYTLHMDVGSIRIKTPVAEKRIGAVHRGAGPIGLKEAKWGSFDSFLQELAVKQGAQLIRERVQEVKWADGRPQIGGKGDQLKTYDLLVVATGVNTATIKNFEAMGIGYVAPRSTKTYIREFHFGEDAIEKLFGNSMHVFLLDIPRLEFAALIPKRDFVTMCLLGKDIDSPLVQSFLDAPEVKRCLPHGVLSDKYCRCSPSIVVSGAEKPFSNRLVFIGDCGVTRLYKDGIGAAYRTSKAAAMTAMFIGVSADDFRRHFWPTCRAITYDNAIGRIVFLVTHLIQKVRPSRYGLLRMVTREQLPASGSNRMSTVLWDTFTGSAPYYEVFLRTLHPGFLYRFTLDTLAGVWSNLRRGNVED